MDRQSSDVENYKKPSDAGNIAMAVVFFLFVFALSAAGPLLPDREFSPQENRYLTTRPALNLRDIRTASYMGAIEKYITDQFPGRDLWVSSKAALQKVSGQKENNDVFFAADGYLIGKPQNPPVEIADRNLDTVLAFAGAGYEIALLASPMAAEILRDKLPPWAYTPVQADLLARLRREAPEVFVDTEPSLRKAAADGWQVFYRTDHHWTTAGAFLAYQAYMDWLGEEPVPLDGFEEQTVASDFRGTLWSKNSLPCAEADRIGVFELKPPASHGGASPLQAPGGGPAQKPGLHPGLYTVEFFEGDDMWTADTVYQEAHLKEKDKYAYFLGQNRPLVVIRRQGDALGSAAGGAPADGSEATGTAPRKLMVFKDSYAHCFAPFLLYHFDEIHLADLRYWRQDPVAYMEEHGLRQVLFLYNADDFAGDRSISQAGAYLSLNTR